MSNMAVYFKVGTLGLNKQHIQSSHDSGHIHNFNSFHVTVGLVQDTLKLLVKSLLCDHRLQNRTLR